MRRFAFSPTVTLLDSVNNLPMLLVVFVLLFTPVSVQAEEVLVTIDSVPFTSSDLQAAVAAGVGEARWNTLTKESKQQLFNQIVQRQLIVRSSYLAGYDRDPEMVAQFEQLMVGRYLQEQLQPQLDQLKVSNDEVESYYKRHINDFTSPAKVRAALIQIEVPARANDEARQRFRQRAEAAYQAASQLAPATPTFGSVAVDFSADQATRYRGGDTGWLKVGETDLRWGKDVAAAIFKLAKPGDLSPIIEAEKGYFILKLVDQKPAVTKPFAGVLSGVRYLALQEKRQRAEATFYQELGARLGLEINQQQLDNILTPAVEQQRATPPAMPAS